MKTKTKKIATGVIYATKKTQKAAKHMPDEVVVSLEGEAKGRLLTVAGWSMTTSAKDKACKKWPVARLKLNLGRIEEEWVEEIGKGWKLEIAIVNRTVKFFRREQRERPGDGPGKP